MRRIFFFLLLFIYAVSVGFILLQLYHAQARNRTLSETNQSLSVNIEELKVELNGLNEYVSQYSFSGGAETFITDQSDWNNRIVFPVAEEDFLRFTSPYGRRISPFLGIEMHHSGIDIAAVWRAQILSIADGIVVEHWPPPGTPHPLGGSYKGHPIYGGMVRIDHGHGIESLYAHFDSTQIREHQRVSAGQVIGRVGDTGMARGNHLHLEMKIDGELVNPLLYITREF